MQTDTYLSFYVYEHMNFIKRYCGIKNLKDMSFQTYSKLFHACVFPVLVYTAGVWGLRNIFMCESVL